MPLVVILGTVTFSPRPRPLTPATDQTIRTLTNAITSLPGGSTCPPSPLPLPLPLSAALLHNTIALIGNNWGAEQKQEPRARAHPAPLEKSFPNACHILNYIEICAHNEEDQDSHRGQFVAHSNLLAFSAILSLSLLSRSLPALPAALCSDILLFWYIYLIRRLI